MFAGDSICAAVKTGYSEIHDNFKSGETVQSNKYWFDRKGNDSARIIYGKKISIRNTYKNGKIVFAEHIKEEGKPDTYEYTYTGSVYKKTYTDGDYGMKSYEWFDAKGKLIKSQSPDGNTTTYKYDPKGRLTSFISDGANQGMKIRQANTYDSKGKLIKTNYIRDNDTSVVIYSYNSSIQLISEEEKGVSQGEAILIKTSYQYNSKGLVEKTTSTRKWGAEEEQATAESFQYEYY